MVICSRYIQSHFVPKMNQGGTRVLQFSIVTRLIDTPVNQTKILQFCYKQPWLLIEEVTGYHMPSIFQWEKRSIYVGEMIQIFIRKQQKFIRDSRFKIEIQYLIY